MAVCNKCWDNFKALNILNHVGKCMILLNNKLIIITMLALYVIAGCPHMGLNNQIIEYWGDICTAGSRHLRKTKNRL